jgi:hypothetical protein
MLAATSQIHNATKRCSQYTVHRHAAGPIVQCTYMDISCRLDSRLGELLLPIMLTRIASCASQSSSAALAGPAPAPATPSPDSGPGWM